MSKQRCIVFSEMYQISISHSKLLRVVNKNVKSWNALTSLTIIVHPPRQAISSWAITIYVVTGAAAVARGTTCHIEITLGTVCCISRIITLNKNRYEWKRHCCHVRCLNRLAKKVKISHYIEMKNNTTQIYIHTINHIKTVSTKSS